MYQTNFESVYVDKYDYLRKSEMEHARTNSLNKIFTFIPHLEQVENFAAILSYTYKERLPEAINLADSLDLCQLDFYAIDENLEDFCLEFEELQFSKYGEY